MYWFMLVVEIGDSFSVFFYGGCLVVASVVFCCGWVVVRISVFYVVVGGPVVVGEVVGILCIIVDACAAL